MGSTCSIVSEDPRRDRIVVAEVHMTDLDYEEEEEEPVEEVQPAEAFNISPCVVDITATAPTAQDAFRSASEEKDTRRWCSTPPVTVSMFRPPKLPNDQPHNSTTAVITHQSPMMLSDTANATTDSLACRGVDTLHNTSSSGERHMQQQNTCDEHVITTTEAFVSPLELPITAVAATDGVTSLQIKSPQSLERSAVNSASVNSSSTNRNVEDVSFLFLQSSSAGRNDSIMRSVGASKTSWQKAPNLKSFSSVLDPSHMPRISQHNENTSTAPPVTLQITVASPSAKSLMMPAKSSSRACMVDGRILSILTTTTPIGIGGGGAEGGTSQEAAQGSTPVWSPRQRATPRLSAVGITAPEDVLSSSDGCGGGGSSLTPLWRRGPDADFGPLVSAHSIASEFFSSEDVVP